MRMVIAIFCLIAGGFLGWIVGSLYPAPSAWLALINRDAIAQRLNELRAPQSAAPPSALGPASTLAPASSTAAQPPPAAASDATDDATLKQYRAWIGEARLKYPYADSEERMYAVMICESKGKAALVNPAGPYSGLFQYGSGTWKGAWNDYRDQNVLDPKAQIFATAQAWQKHMQGQWGCYKHAP